MFIVELSRLAIATGVYWFTDSGRPRNGMFVVESGRLGIEIERDLGLSTSGDMSLFSLFVFWVSWGECYS